MTVPHINSSHAFTVLLSSELCDTLVMQRDFYTSIIVIVAFDTGIEAGSINYLPYIVLHARLCTIARRWIYIKRYGGTPLNNPPIEKHANSSMFALIFWPHVTIFCIFWLHECLKWILKFNSKSLFWCQSRQIFEVRAIEQRHHEFQLIHMPPHQFWPRYHSDGLSPVHVRFEFFF